MIGGNIFDGEKFVKKDLFIVRGKITFKKPSNLETNIDITTKFVVPPFGDAHTHNLDRTWQLPLIPNQYLKEGTFYVQNLTSKTTNIGYYKKYFSTKDTIDVRYSHQGLTSTLGHPFLVYEPFAMGLNDFSKWKENMEKIKKSRLDENNSYIFIDNKKQAKRKLKKFFAQKPDIVKIFLLDIANYTKNSTTDKAGDSGLSSKVAKFVVKEAKKRNLRVYAHIETAKDFEMGVDLGVFAFAHIPMWDGESSDKERFEVSGKLMKKAIQKGIAIMPTITIMMSGFEKEPKVNRLNEMRKFLSKYKSLGGKILIGSDIFGRTLTSELKNFITLGVFNKLELLKLVSEETPRAIFPKRKIGYLKEGYEASVLVLNANPLKNFENLFDIKLRIKQGVMLNNSE